MQIEISIDVENLDQLRTQLHAAQEAGFRFCQLFYRGQDLNKENAKLIKAMCDRFGIEIGPIGGYINALKPQEKPMGYSLNRLFGLIELMPLFESRELVIWSGTYSDEHMFQADERNHTPKALVQLKKITEALLKKMELFDGHLIFEPFFTHILGDEQTIVTFIDDLQTDRVKIALDPPNFMTPERFAQPDQSLTGLFEKMWPYTAGLHFKDIRRIYNDSWPFAYPGPGDGELDYHLISKLVKKEPLHSWGIIEHVQPNNYGSAKQFIDRIFEGDRAS